MLSAPELVKIESSKSTPTPASQPVIAWPDNARVLLTAPYVPDRQYSMQRFVSMLTAELANLQIPFELLTPAAPRLDWLSEHWRARALKAWGLIAKFWLLPLQIRRRQTALSKQGIDSIVHVTDQGSAQLVLSCLDQPHLLTVHDLLAQAQALGLPTKSGHRGSWIGRWLQKRIARGIAKSKAVVCVTEATGRDYVSACPDAALPQVIANGLNFPFQPTSRAQAERRWAQYCAGIDALSAVSLPGEYLMHIGSAWYKNRAVVLQIYQGLKSKLQRQTPALILVGDALEPALAAVADELGVIQVSGADSELIEALYGQARCLLFPSLFEGFGWPILEAQACGTPVITSDREPMSQLAGDAGLLINPEDVDAGVAAVTQLLEESAPARAQRIAVGIQHASKFSAREMTRQYVQRYVEILQAR